MNHIVTTEWLPDLIRPMGMFTELRPKKCKWCRGLIYFNNFYKNSLYCSKDCKIDQQDHEYLQFTAKERVIKKRKLPKGRDMDKVKARKKLYYQKNKEKIKKQMRSIRKRNKLKSNES